MKSYIERFPSQLEEAYAIGSLLSFANIQNVPDFENIVILGMGGSAFGGELVRNYCEGRLKVPLFILRDYTVPRFISERSLVIASSYSGNTEETLSALQESIQAKAFVVCISSGGKLLEIAKAHKFPFIELPKGYPPRAAVGFSFLSQLFILRKLDLIPDFQQDFQEALKALQNFSDYDQARQYAEHFHDKIPIFYSAPANEAVIIRLRQQIQENAKQLCWHHTIPEMNHNELVGWELPSWFLSRCYVCIVRSAYDFIRIQYRMDFLKEKLLAKGVAVGEWFLKGNNRMAELLYGLHFSDWISYELALKNGVDPVPVKVIDELKNSLAAK